MNNAAGALNKIPGAAGITGALGSVSGATDLLAKVKASGSTLSSLAATGLPPSAAAQMTAAISSLSSAGPIPIKLPTVAINTTDRGAITAGLAAVFGSKLVPMPNFAGNPATFGKVPSDEEAKKYNEKKALIEKTMDEYWELKNSGPAWRAYDAAKNSLPQGDPQIDSLKAAADAEQAAAAALLKKVDELRRS